MLVSIVMVGLELLAALTSRIAPAVMVLPDTSRMTEFRNVVESFL